MVDKGTDKGYILCIMKKKKEKVINGFSERLRKLRKEKNLSQTELGDQAGIHFTHISQYERNVSQPSMENLKRLAMALGVTADYLIDGSSEDAAKVSFKDQEFLSMFKEIEKLPDDDKVVIKKLIEAFLTKHKIQNLVHA